MILDYIDTNGKKLFSYNLVKRTKQKTIILSIKNNIITISCPINLRSKHINVFIEKNINKIVDLISRYKNNRVLSFSNSNSFIYILGKKHRLVLVDENIHTKFTNEILFIKSKSNYLEQTKLLYSFLRREYNNLFFELINKWIEITNLDINELKIKNMHSKWGICYNKLKRIILNVKLIHFDIEIIEYVILHELIHLKFPFHNDKFWKQIYHFMPNYKNKNKILQLYCI